jgi:hypothetical protein
VPEGKPIDVNSLQVIVSSLLSLLAGIVGVLFALLMNRAEGRSHVIEESV